MATVDHAQTLQLVEWHEGCGEGGEAVISILPSERVPFAIRREDAGGRLVIVLEGELDLATAPQLAAVIDSFSPDERITIDLCRLDFMDCSGLRELMRASAVLGDGLHVVCGRHGPVRRLFDVAAVEQMLSVYSSHADALQAAQGPNAGSRRASHSPLLPSGVKAASVRRRREV